MRCKGARAVVWLGVTCASAGLSVLAVPPPAGVRASPAPASSAGDLLPAVWKAQRVDFFYRGRTARYSCEGLRDKVRAILLDLGARRDVEIIARRCRNNGRLPVNSINPVLTVRFSAPAEPDATAKPPGAGDPAATEARFVAFTITSDAFRNMGIGDCELVEEFTRQILPKLATRRVKHDISCMPYRRNTNHFLVQGEILKALPRDAQAADQPPFRAP